MRRAAVILTFLLLSMPACAGTRVALVIGHDAYPGGTSATIGLPRLYNSGNDVAKVADLLARHGFEVMSCDGKRPGCFDLDRKHLLKALADLTAKAKGADTALLYFAGHGMASAEGNVLTPIDARVNCDKGDVTNGVEVEAFLAATEPARHKLVILDACRNNPLGEVCPSLKGKKLSFTRIEAGAMQGLLLVTSTQFGQEALDGSMGTNSPFAKALVASLEANPGIYFEQVMNEVGRATYAAAQKEDGFQQIPGKVVGTPAPDDCLAGKGCVGDMRMAALADENEKLTADASAVRNILADEETRRGKAYTVEERQAAVERIGRSLTSLAGSAEPKVKEASQLFSAGKVAEARAKLDEALDDDEKAAVEIERLAKERRKTLARNARDAARLAVGSDIAKALVYFERATRNDPDDAATWIDLGEAARDIGQTSRAKAAFERATAASALAGDVILHSKSNYRQGDIAMMQGSLPSARRFYEASLDIIMPATRARPDNLALFRESSVAQVKIGDVLVAQGNLAAALHAFRDGLAIAERLANADPGNSGAQRYLSVILVKTGNVLLSHGNLPEALTLFRDSFATRDRLAKAEPGNGSLQRDLLVSHERIGTVLLMQGQLAQALQSFRDGQQIIERLSMTDPGNIGWKRDRVMSFNKVGDVLGARGKLEEALQSYRDGLAIIEAVAKSDTANAEWQRDLSVSYGKVGDILKARGNLPEASKSFHDSLAIREHLAKADPGNGSWQRDVFESLWRVSDVAIAQGDLAAAITYARRGQEIMDKLSRGDPSNRLWQRDSWVSYNKVGDVQMAQGDLPEALKSFRDSLAIVDRLARSDPGNSGWQRDLGASYKKIGDVMKAQGNLPEALKSFRNNLAIRDELAKSDPGNSGWQRDLSMSHANLADAFRRSGDTAKAREHLNVGRAIIARLVAAHPDWAEWKRDLAWFDGQIASLDGR